VAIEAKCRLVFGDILRDMGQIEVRKFDKKADFILSLAKFAQN